MPNYLLNTEVLNKMNLKIIYYSPAFIFFAVIHIYWFLSIS